MTCAPAIGAYTRPQLCALKPDETVLDTLRHAVDGCRKRGAGRCGQHPSIQLGRYFFA